MPGQRHYARITALRETEVSDSRPLQTSLISSVGCILADGLVCGQITLVLPFESRFRIRSF